LFILSSFSFQIISARQLSVVLLCVQDNFPGDALADD
jgi:hypothetical protein